MQPELTETQIKLHISGHSPKRLAQILKVYVSAKDWTVSMGSITADGNGILKGTLTRDLTDWQSWGSKGNMQFYVTNKRGLWKLWNEPIRIRR